MKMNLDKGSKFIINKLIENNYKAYAVGGSVRNSLLNLPINDYDIVTNAKPDEIMSLFQKTIPTGLKHGTVTVVYDNVNYEVTTFRVESQYENNRKPKDVIFVESIEEDLKRRDFTINAMAYDLVNDEIIDLYGGEHDLHKRIIKCVGEADVRFNEDALRMLRAVRFASTYNFNIEANTMLSICKNAHLIENISYERIYSELCKILMSPKPSKGITLLLYTSLLHHILPELIPMASFNQFSKYHDKDVFFHTMNVLDNIKENLVLRLSALFHDSGKPYTYSMDENNNGHFYNHEDVSVRLANEALTRLKVDNKTKKMVSLVIGKHMVPLDISKRSKIKKLINEYGKENMEMFFDFKIADHSGKPKEVSMDNNFYTLRDKVKEILLSDEALEIKDLKINGEDLEKLNIEKGPKYKEILNYLLQKVIVNPEYNEKDKLIKLVEDYINNEQ